MNDKFFDSVTLCAHTVTAPQVAKAAASMSSDELLQSIQDAIAAVPPCPFRELMMGQDSNPDDGWLMVIPSEAAVEYDRRLLPSYVRVSRLVDGIVLINPGNQSPPKPITGGVNPDV